MTKTKRDFIAAQSAQWRRDLASETPLEMTRGGLAGLKPGRYKGERAKATA